MMKTQKFLEKECSQKIDNWNLTKNILKIIIHLRNAEQKPDKSIYFSKALNDRSEGATPHSIHFLHISNSAIFLKIVSLSSVIKFPQMVKELVTFQLDKMIMESDRKSCIYQKRNFIVFIQIKLIDMVGNPNLIQHSTRSKIRSIAFDIAFDRLKVKLVYFIWN